ncbi:TylF/MycF/NovP-related O-methyltransferase [Microlunatus soli]|uniref:Macrocin-O-methyltransferase (TylF) n=1 Tax=Microlunatus soli TaxID=630515 RepID=A0A1H2A9P1_9ACTN|nr:TylF/MycF/NovP-related O-methyltransferase [Microlunatus soli]SDT42492.1 Macrocin-O-methyltransferase (TylF) [Microlunatus soli]
MNEPTMKRRLRSVGRQGRTVVTRGKAVLRRAVGPDEELQAKLDFANSEVRRLRSLVKAERKTSARWKKELQLTRRSLMDPLPRAELPDGVAETIERARGERLSYLGIPELTVLARQVHDADLAGREGLIIEAGTARGGSAIVMAAAKDPARPMKVYDVFDQIPAPTDADGSDVKKRYEQIQAGGARGVAGDTYYGYRDDLYTEVTESFARLGVPVEDNNVELVKGLFADTIDLDQPVAFAHLDGDWYESTMTCLERIVPLLSRGGRIVLDDYFHWSGCRTAVDEYFANRSGFLLERRNKVHVIKL